MMRELPHKDIAEYTPIERLAIFVKYLIDSGLVRSEREFALLCGLSQSYIGTLIRVGNGDVRSGALRQIKTNFPALNLNWLVMGEGEMLIATERTDAFYKQLYESATQHITILQQIIKHMEVNL